ncbi:MAG: hypothetical protein EXS30_10230 [Pedosphaera sp.]|nr:hypothetical protein [Pedosphaera sp.]
MTAVLDIEKSDNLLRYLHEHGHLEPGEVPTIVPLSGGVSNRTMLVERSDGTAFVIKQALEKLRVEADWRSDPNRSHREALGLTWLARLGPPGTITPLLFEDTDQHLLAMQAVARPHENWKSRLMAGGLELSHVKQFGQLLGTIHRRSREQRPELEPVFDDRSYFESLRIEPYYRYTAERNRETSIFFTNLISETAATREALVHGDYSPKNILIHQNTLVLLDHEVIHFGDPAFDIGFSLTHLLSKAHHLDSSRERFLEGARVYWKTYQTAAGELGFTADFEPRAVRHTLGCLLARVDGRSPLEYFTTAERNRQRAVVLPLLKSPPDRMLTLIERFGQGLQGER